MSNTSSKSTDLSPVIGITGGIGSGKSLVCKIFMNLGIPVFEADRVAKSLYRTDPILKEELIRLFGSRVLDPAGEVDRKYLAALIFSHRDALDQVNRLVHPRVREAFVRWRRARTAPYVLHEAAILFESGFYRMMDAVILVVAPEEMRIQRVAERDHLSRESVAARMKNQWPDSRKIKLANYLIVNDESRLIMEQILEIDQKIKAHGKFC